MTEVPHPHNPLLDALDALPSGPHIVELGQPGPIATVELDTHWHDGNHAEYGALRALRGEGGEPPSRDDPRWVELLPPSRLDGHAHNVFRTPAGMREAWTHVMLENHPDGGIARLRCYADRAPMAVDPGTETEKHVRHAEAIPRGTDGVHHGPSAQEVAARWRSVSEENDSVDLACEAFGGRVVATSNNRYGHSQQLLAEAAPKSMGDGWETSRSRGAGHFDYVVVALGRAGVIDLVEVDFTFFPLNNPVAMRLLGANVASGTDVPPEDAWTEIAGRTEAKSFAGRVLRLERSALGANGPFTHVRLETYPDGGANRLRVFGRAARTSGA